MERSHREDGIEGKFRKDIGNDLWYRPGPLAEFKRIPMPCLVQEQATTASTAMAANFRFIRNAAGYNDKSCLCARCMGNALPIDGRPQSQVQVGPDKLEVVAG